MAAFKNLSCRLFAIPQTAHSRQTVTQTAVCVTQLLKGSVEWRRTTPSNLPNGSIPVPPVNEEEATR
jgi:hypothetical protein